MQSYLIALEGLVNEIFVSITAHNSLYNPFSGVPYCNFFQIHLETVRKFSFSLLLQIIILEMSSLSFGQW